jgi:hypothetical protein
MPGRFLRKRGRNVLLPLDGIDREWMAPVRLTKRRAQQLDMIRKQR